MNDEIRVERLTDDELIARTETIAARGRRNDAALVAHMAEVDARRLYLREACSSMFVYATERLRLSECQAYERISAARTARVAPAVLEMLAEGRLTAPTVALLRPHLTKENAAEVLARADGKSKRQVLVLIAELAPKADAPSVIRKLPEVRPEPVAQTEVRPEPVRPAPPPLVLEPIAPARFKVQFTASAELEAKIRKAQALLRHAVPGGDVAEIVSACEGLEVHHEEPFARGGPSTVENLRLLCRQHNRYRAEVDYGRAFVEERIRGGS